MFVPVHMYVSLERERDWPTSNACDWKLGAQVHTLTCRGSYVSTPTEYKDTAAEKETHAMLSTPLYAQTE